MRCSLTMSPWFGRALAQQQRRCAPAIEGGSGGARRSTLEGATAPVLKS
ncbi:hypothetical protein AB3662_07610 [Sorangium cellulosum]